ncbi:MAG: hypothetical protein IJ646_01690 [Clostridia bacterium]|nr:hypothetical protein [Clostridia bacterium]
MGLFSDPNERERKENLRKLEDKRLALAQELDKKGFKPEKMLFASTENGGFVATCRHNGRQWVIASPGFGTEEPFIVEDAERFPVRKQEVLVKSEGMGGILGFGKKGEHGVEYVITLSDGSEVKLPIVFGRSCWAEYPLRKNPLLDTRRRRKDGNIVWELRPVDNGVIDRIIENADQYFA